MKKILFTSLLVVSLSACQANYQKQQLGSAESLLKEGKHTQAYVLLEGSLFDHLTNDQDTAKDAVANIKSYPELQEKIPFIIRQHIPELKHSSNTASLYEAVKALKRHDLIDAKTEKSLIDELNAHATQGNQSDSIAFVLSDTNRMPELAGLQTPTAQQKILNRSLKQMSATDSVADSDLVKAVFALAEESKGTATYNTIRNKIPSMSLRVSDINQYVAPLFPAQAKQLIDKNKVTVRIITQPTDRLLYEDLKTKINAISPAISVVSGSADVAVTVKQLKWDEREAQQQNQTVTYGRGDVNLLEAALLMPKYSSYQYDVTSGGREVSFAFEVKASGKEVGKFDELVRETISATWSECSNARVQNAFGGTTSAGFVANNHMSQTCNDSDDTSSDNLRSQALDRIIWKIKTITPIKRASSAYSRY